ncbi:MAG: tRNA 2-selenouridine(34) synthase MnmH [Deferribacteraceae bacterium]|jgi:tRNA 2-selenouridine synthase|nr:tRNA 2-selenouridine(34) synthase MnmH [Deferribacteraceae bacterium]
MLLSFTYEEYEKKLAGRCIMVDVRSPAEFAESSIPGAINIALFSNEERAHVGTVYKQEGKHAAVALGVDYVSKSLPRIYASFRQAEAKQKKFMVFCARGGMRSEAVGSFLASIGFSVLKLDSGYKGYRQHVLAKLPALIDSIDIVTLYGKTGTGKTHIIHALQEADCDTLDLEAYAGHRGSVFGGLGLQQRSQKQFESLLYEALVNAKSKLIFTEGESRRIGSIYMPKELSDKMASGRKLLIEADIETRKQIIMQDYTATNFDKTAAITALKSLVRYIGHARIAEYQKLIEDGQIAEIAEVLMLQYYDIVYNTLHMEYEKVFTNVDPVETAAAIMEYMK